MRKTLLIGALLLSGCASSPEKIVYAAKVSFDGALLAANHYAEDLPRCSTTQAPPCSDQAVIDKANAAAHKAAPILDDAEKYVRAAAAAAANPKVTPPAAGTVAAQANLAAAAVSELTTVTATMGVK